MRLQVEEDICCYHGITLYHALASANSGRRGVCCRQDCEAWSARGRDVVSFVRCPLSGRSRD